MDTQTTAETWEQRTNRERAEKGAVIAKIERRFKNILKLLGLPDCLEKNRDDNYAARAEGGTAGKESIYLISDEYNHKFERVAVSGKYPRFKTGAGYVQVYGDDNQEVLSPEITVNLKKTDEQIAKDIERRFLPDYRKRLALVSARIKVNDEYNAKTNSALESIKAILTGGKGLDKYETERKEFNEHLGGDDGPRIQVKASGSDVTLEIRCSRDLAEKVARFIEKEA